MVSKEIKKVADGKEHPWIWMYKSNCNTKTFWKHFLEWKQISWQTGIFGRKQPDILPKTNGFSLYRFQYRKLCPFLWPNGTSRYISFEVFLCWRKARFLCNHIKLHIPKPEESVLKTWRTIIWLKLFSPRKGLDFFFNSQISKPRIFLLF